MVSSRTVRDPIHGMMRLYPKEWDAVGSRVFQRMRHIRQLAMTHLVYPGATHTRFEHSLGVCHVAGRLAQKLEVEGEDFEHVRYAALLHDIGHGPFSHVSEGLLEERSGGLKGCHEAISGYLIRNDDELRDALGEDARDAAARLVEKAGPRTYLGDIVSGPTDADRLDYLLRDSYFAGVKVGYDLDRIVDTATVIDRDQPESFLGFEEDGVWAVEGLLLARHHMHRQVYGHKTRIATDIMVTRALQIAVEDGVLPADAYTMESAEGKPKVTAEFVDAYLQQTDSSVMEKLLADETKVSYQLADRLVRRDLLKRSASYALHRERDRLGGPQRAKILDKSHFEPRRAELEEEIASSLDCEPFLVAIQIDSQSNPTYRGPGTEINASDVMLAYRDGPPDTFERESEIFDEESGEEHSFAHLYTPRLPEERLSDAKEMLWNALTKA